ncbi:MAG TPA: RND transporter, partial [Marinobacter antarcticus]|nr:RND transporter [Marinobacter antarcticus]
MINQVARSLSEFSIRHRTWVAVVIFASTALMALNLLKIDVRTEFSDMIPSSHAYVDVHETYKETFGGSNKVSILVEARNGDIMTRPILEEVHRITRELAKV